MKKAANIWCDGSFREAHKTSGAGWVIKHVDGQVEEQYLTLPKLQDSLKYGSEIAELAAAAHAMNTLPPGTNAHIHMDCQSSLNIIEKGQLPKKNRDGSAHELQCAFSAAMEAKARLGTVAFQLTSDRNENMHRAHVLSQAASTPGKQQKPERHEKPGRR